MRIVIIGALLLVVGCGGSSTGVGGAGGAGGSGGSGGAGGSGGGTGGDTPIATCTPGGFATAPSAVNQLPKPGLANAQDHSAFVTFLSNDGGLGDISAKITVEDDFSRDGGATVPAGVTARFNGCPLASIFDVPGVGREFSAMGAATFAPTAGRFVAFEVLDAQGTLLFRRSVGLAQVLPRITSVTNPTGPMATVAFTAIPDAGVENAYLSAYKRIGTGGLQSTGFYTNPPISTGTATFPVTNQTNRFDLQLNCGPVRLTSRFDTP